MPHNGYYRTRDSRKMGKMHKVMSEFKEGMLHSGSGKVVKKRKQAVAIAMSEAGLSKKKGRKNKK